MGPLHRPSTEMKRLARGALRSIGPSPELIADLLSLRNAVDANSRRVDELATEVASVAAAVRALETARDEQASSSPTQVNRTLAGLGERVHAHEQELKATRVKLEQFGASLLDGMALDRRLRNIEDRIL